MTAEEVLEYMHGLDLTVTLVGENLLVTPPGQMTTEIRAIMQSNKQALVALLRQCVEAPTILPEPAISSAQAIAMTLERPLTDDEKRRVEEAFKNLRDQYGHALVEAGWHRQAVFSGTDPLAATTVDGVHGVIGLLMGGGQVVGITQKAIYFRLADGSRVAWLRGGCFVGDPYLQELELTTLT